MEVTLPTAFQFLFQPSRYKAIYGGRGSAKSHSVATALVLKAAAKPLRILCGREIQNSIKDSVKRLIDDKIKECGLENFYKSTETEVRGRNGSLFIFAGLKTNIQSIKSMEGIDIAWIEEADTLSQNSLNVLVPTIRKEDSEIWFTWNPANELDAVDMMFRGKVPPPNTLVRQVSYDVNPFFPEVLRKEMEFDKVNDIEKYEHVWRGGYRVTTQGAYYSKQISTAIAENRITGVPYDSHAPVYVSFDLGISDSTALWFVQKVGQEIHVIDAYESNGQPIDHYAQLLRQKPYIYAKLILPHDARAKSLGTGKSIEEVLRGLNFETVICPNIPIKDGIDHARSFIGRCWFDQEKCAEGLKNLRAYRENFDERLKISRGPLHDFTSHYADSFRYMAVGLQENNGQKQAAANAMEGYLERLQGQQQPLSYANRQNPWDRYKPTQRGSGLKSF